MGGNIAHPAKVRNCLLFLTLQHEDGARQRPVLTFTANLKTDYLRTRSFNERPAEKAGNFVAGIWMVSPVWGLRPSRFLRLRSWNVPKPVICTLRPDLSSDAMMPCFGTVLKIASTTILESFRVRPVRLATRSISSVLFKMSPPSRSYADFIDAAKNVSTIILRFFA